VFPAIKAGAMGYLLKDSAPNDLLHAVHNAYQGIPSLAPSIALKLIQEIDHPSGMPNAASETLTEREILILKHVAQGLTNHEICAARRHRPARRHGNNSFTSQSIGHLT
jgi:NarL family two-component system response regulator LiaR